MGTPAATCIHPLYVCDAPAVWCTDKKVTISHKPQMNLVCELLSSPAQPPVLEWDDITRQLPYSCGVEARKALFDEHVFPYVYVTGKRIVRVDWVLLLPTVKDPLQYVPQDVVVAIKRRCTRLGVSLGNGMELHRKLFAIQHKGMDPGTIQQEALKLLLHWMFEAKLGLNIHHPVPQLNTYLPPSLKAGITPARIQVLSGATLYDDVLFVPHIVDAYLVAPLYPVYVPDTRVQLSLLDIEATATMVVVIKTQGMWYIKSATQFIGIEEDSPLMASWMTTTSASVMKIVPASNFPGLLCDTVVPIQYNYSAGPASPEVHTRRFYGMVMRVLGDHLQWKGNVSIVCGAQNCDWAAAILTAYYRVTPLTTFSDVSPQTRTGVVILHTHDTPSDAEVATAILTMMVHPHTKFVYITPKPLFAGGLDIIRTVTFP